MIPANANLAHIPEIGQDGATPILPDSSIPQLSHRTAQ